jgi:hypothetical protein
VDLLVVGQAHAVGDVLSEHQVLNVDLPAHASDTLRADP